MAINFPNSPLLNQIFKSSERYYKWNGVQWNCVGFTSCITITGVTTYYQSTSSDDYISINANVPVLIDLPSYPTTGKKITIKDEGNKISTYNVTVRAGIGASVENNTSVVMKINHQSFTYFYNGSNWFLV
jgi:hypothetical protein